MDDEDEVEDDDELHLVDSAAKSPEDAVSSCCLSLPPYNKSLTYAAGC